MPKTLKNTLFTLEKGWVMDSNPATPTKNVLLKPRKGAFRISGKKKRVKKGVNRKRFMDRKLAFKIPTIVRGKPKGDAILGTWFIQYYFEHPERPGYFKPWKVKDGINYLHDPEQREEEAQRLRNDVERHLKRGFNPFAPDVKKDVVEQITEARKEAVKIKNIPKYFTLPQACKRFMDYCVWKKLSPNTIKFYQSFVNNFSDWIAENKLENVEARKYTKKHIYLFLDTYNDQEDWEARTYNNHIDFFKTFFKRVYLIEKEELLERDVDVFYRMELADAQYKKDTAERNRAYTPQVAALIKTQLDKKGNEQLRDFVEWIFHSCMRPKEIRLLKIQHIDLSMRQVKVIGPTAKTGDRFTPISDELMALIKKRGLLDMNPNCYVFGNEGTAGPILFHRNYFSRRYLKIKETLNLDKNYTMYGWKHTAVILMILAGFTDAQIMERTGHRDIESFKVYKRDLVLFIEAIPFDQQVMKGKTIEF